MKHKKTSLIRISHIYSTMRKIDSEWELAGSSVQCSEVTLMGGMGGWVKGGPRGRDIHIVN